MNHILWIIIGAAVYWAIRRVLWEIGVRSTQGRKGMQDFIKKLNYDTLLILRGVVDKEIEDRVERKAP